MRNKIHIGDVEFKSKAKAVRLRDKLNAFAKKHSINVEQRVLKAPSGYILRGYSIRKYREGEK